MTYEATRRRRLARALIGAAVLLLVNTVYLAGWPSATLFFYGNVALHVVLGAIVTILAIAYRASSRGRWPLAASAAWLALIACAGAGGWLTAVGATRAHSAALAAHGGLAAAAVLFTAVWFDWARIPRWSTAVVGAA